MAPRSRWKNRQIVIGERLEHHRSLVLNDRRSRTAAIKSGTGVLGGLASIAATVGAKRQMGCCRGVGGYPDTTKPPSLLLTGLLSAFVPLRAFA
jgi:hypothetical protein